MDSVPSHESRGGPLGGPPADHRPITSRQPSRTRRVVWFLVMLVIAVVVLGGFYGFETFKQKMMGQYFASMVPPPTPVATAAATAQSMPRYLDTIGTMTAVHQVTVTPEVAGRVADIKFESGAAVKANTPLVQLDDATERADLASYQAQVRLAQVNLERARQLATKQFGSKQSVDEAQSSLDQAQAGIAKVQAQINYKLIPAPFDGVLGIRQINLGQYLDAGAAIVTLTNLDELYVDFSLPEQDQAQLAKGQQIEIRSDAYPGRRFMAVLQTIDPQVDAQMRAVKLRATLPNPDHALQPGMYARVRVVLAPEQNVVTLPETAVDYTVYGDSVFIVRDNGKDKEGKPLYKVEQVFVTVGSHDAGKVSLLKGVSPGDRVVVGGQLKLHNGAAVSLSSDTSLIDPPAATNE